MGRGRWSSTPAAIVALWVKIGACAFAIVADVRRYAVVGRIEDGSALPDELLGADQFVNVATLAEALAMVAVVVVVGTWQRRTGTRMVLPWVLFAVSVVAVVVLRSIDAQTPDDRQLLDLAHVGAAALSIAAAIVAFGSVRDRDGGPAGPAERPEEERSGLLVVREDELPKG